MKKIFRDENYPCRVKWCKNKKDKGRCKFTEINFDDNEKCLDFVYNDRICLRKSCGHYNNKRCSRKINLENCLHHKKPRI